MDFYNPRDFVKPTKVQSKKDKPYLRVDDKPYGGGPGMVIQAEPVLKAIEKAIAKLSAKSLKLKKNPKAKSSKLKVKIVFFSLKGYGKVYLKGLIKGLSFCFTKEARSHKVGFRFQILPAYWNIQLELWANIFVLLFGSNGKKPL